MGSSHDRHKKPMMSPSVRSPVQKEARSKSDERLRPKPTVTGAQGGALNALGKTPQQNKPQEQPQAGNKDLRFSMQYPNELRNLTEILAPLSVEGIYGNAGSDEERNELVDYARIAISKLLEESLEQDMNDLRHIAYLLATVEHESHFGRITSENISRERAAALGYGGGHRYRGRGYIQLTHRENYQRASNYLNEDGRNFDLVNNPELANNPDLAAEIAVRGLLGREDNYNWFTAKEDKTIENLIPTNTTDRQQLREDFVDARVMVNPGEERGDKVRTKIADRALVYYDVLNQNILSWEEVRRRIKRKADRMEDILNPSNPTLPSVPPYVPSNPLHL